MEEVLVGVEHGLDRRVSDAGCDHLRVSSLRGLKRSALKSAFLRRELRLRVSERRVPAMDTPVASSTLAKAGRNGSCLCGSGFKCKRCHGLTGLAT